MKLIQGLNYRQWQKRNTEHFNSLTRIQQKEARQQGYYNIGWKQVQNSWVIVCKHGKNVTSLFEHKLHKGNIAGAIELSILEADQAKNLAKKAIERLAQNQKSLDKLADQALTQYPFL